MNRTACWLAALTLLSAHGACSDSSGPAADGSGARDGAAERRGDDGSLPPRDAAGDAPADAPGDGSGAGDSAADAPASAAGWLATKGKHIVTSSGAIWHGRGANLHDTRSCNACTWNPPNVAEVKRRIDELVGWGANFIRLDLESYAQAEGRVHYKPVTDDAQYLADVKAIVDHIGTKPGVYVLLSLWVDATFSQLGWPTAATAKTWELLATTFAADKHVLYGLCNEPQQNFDGARDAEVWKAMNDTVAAIRAVESKLGAQSHIIAVQGTGAWARRLDYYVSHPITAGGGANIAYEVHVYDPSSEHAKLVTQPAATLPVIIGEFGPSSGVSLTDVANLQALAEKLEVPHLAWTFHMRCPPNLIVDPGVGCGVNMQLQPTPWGQQLKSRLAAPW